MLQCVARESRGLCRVDTVAVCFCVLQCFARESRSLCSLDIGVQGSPSSLVEEPQIVRGSRVPHLKLSSVASPPKNGEIALCPNTRVVKCKHCVSQKRNEANDKV